MKNNSNGSVEAFGEIFASIGALSKDPRCIVTSVTVKARIHDYGLTAEEAAILPPFSLVKPKYKPQRSSLRSSRNKLARFFVYVFVYPLTMTPFYVGKGTGRRIHDHLDRYQNDDSLFYRKLRKLEASGVKPLHYKVIENIHEDEALEWEEWLINHYGRVLDGGVLYNIALSGKQSNPSNSIQVEAFGETFPSMSALMHDNRCVVNPQTVYSRIHAGWSPETAATTPAPPRHKGYLFQGEVLSLQELVDHPLCVVSKSQLKQRMRAGIPHTDAATTPIRETATVNAFGETFTIPQLLDDDRCVVTAWTLRNRINSDWDVEEAATTPSTSIDVRTVIAFGEIFTIPRLAKDPRCVVTIGTLRNRLDSGWDVEEAATKPSTPTVRTVVAFGETFTISQLVMDQRCIVSESHLRDRLKDGWTPEDAATKPSAPNGSGNTPIRIKAFGRVFSLKSLTNDSRCVVSRGTIQRRLKDGWSPEDAVTYPAPLPPGLPLPPLSRPIPGFESQKPS